MNKPQASRSIDPAQIVELALIFLRLGTVAFGGPAAHIAVMRTEFVERRKWLTEAEFLDLVGTANLMPGPSSTEVALLIGLRRAGAAGLLAAGLCFILPAALMVCVFAWAYVRYGHLPQCTALFNGVKPVIIAVVCQALWSLGRTAIKTSFLAAMSLGALGLCFIGVPPVIVLLALGATAGILGWFADKSTVSPKVIAGLIGIAIALVLIPALLSVAEPSAGTQADLGGLMLVFLKIGSVVYGSGYVLLAFLRDDLVTRLHWITSAQLLDAVSVGQFTPGPVFTTAAFIGYVINGPWGALVATVGIFVPAFCLIAACGPMIDRIRKFRPFSAFLDGINAGAVALMAFTAIQLGMSAFIDYKTVLIGLVSAALLFGFKINSAWLVAAGAVLGWLLY